MVGDREGASRGRGAARADGRGLRVLIVTTAARQEDPGYIRNLVRPGDILIAADAGVEVAFRLGLRPDLVVGDFDSLDPALLERARAIAPVRSYPARKDKTDTHLALECASEYEPEEIIVAGAFGDRFDHSLGLTLLAAGLPPRPQVRLRGARQEAVFLHGPGATGAGVTRVVPVGLVLRGRPGDTVSLLPLSPAVTGVSTAGLGYPLEGATLRWGETLGVSNEMLGTEAAVSVGGSGTLLVAHLQGAW